MKGLHHSYAGHCELSKVWWICTPYFSIWLFKHLMLMGFLNAGILLSFLCSRLVVTAGI